jgi:hypothetical protein
VGLHDAAVQLAVSKLRQQIAALRDASLADFTQTIAAWVAYLFLFETRHTVDHSFDPPWDHSGQIQDTGQPYRAADYDSLDAFLEEYTGESTATYMSGMGLSWDTFSKALDRKSDDAAREWLLDALAALRRTEPDAFAVFRAQAMEEDEEAFRRELMDADEEAAVWAVLSDGNSTLCEALDILPLAIELRDSVRSLSVPALLAMGQAAAEAKRRAEEEQAQRARVQAAARRERVEMVVAHLAEACPALRPFQRQHAGKTIGKHDPLWKAIRPIIAAWPADRLQLLAESGLFSHTISAMLQRGEIK